MCVHVCICACVCMCVCVHAWKIAACWQVCVECVFAHLSHPTHLPIWLWEQVCLIVHVIFGVGIQILKHPWKSVMGGATCNHGQHKAPALDPHTFRETCQAEQWQLERSTSWNLTCETIYCSNTQAHHHNN